jgi:hypothetical protein
MVWSKWSDTARCNYDVIIAMMRRGESCPTRSDATIPGKQTGSGYGGTREERTGSCKTEKKRIHERKQIFARDPWDLAPECAMARIAPVVLWFRIWTVKNFPILKSVFCSLVLITRPTEGVQTLLVATCVLTRDLLRQLLALQYEHWKFCRVSFINSFHVASSLRFSIP